MASCNETLEKQQLTVCTHTYTNSNVCGVYANSFLKPEIKYLGLEPINAKINATFILIFFSHCIYNTKDENMPHGDDQTDLIQTYCW